MKQKLILIGGGGHCKSCIDVIEQEDRFEIAGILDIEEKIGTNVLGYPVLGTDDMIEDLGKKDYYFFITIGQIESPGARINLFEKLKDFNIKLPVIVSPQAYVSPHASINDGTIIMHHACINAAAKIGYNCIINTKALVEHDASVGDHCHVSTAAIINGGVIIGDRSFIGSGVVTKQYIEIPPMSFVKANSLVK